MKYVDVHHLELGLSGFGVKVSRRTICIALENQGDTNSPNFRGVEYDGANFGVYYLCNQEWWFYHRKN
jgi:hypothetical protein